MPPASIMDPPAAVRVLAVVPAAGQSVRMGQPKLLLPWGRQTVIEAVVAALRAGGVDRVLVVVGPKMEALAERASAAGALIHTLTTPTPDMRSTVEQGLDYLRRQKLLQEKDGWLLAPADHPTLSAGVVRQLLAAFATELATQRNDPPSAATEEQSSAGKLILVPVYQGRRGHPLLVSACCIPALLALPPDQGINALLRHPAVRVCEVPCDDPAILDDLDTPLDYVRLRERPFSG
ncbi:MAG: 4-diphosphocytidyl-2C-methyl-D-erythritol kinase [Gemmataceae bacterium]|nr:MAG: 4-diphosphocytidyl-2C-methyl-D-erythritol kinase [Gemmataceae bacterium]